MRTKLALAALLLLAGCDADKTPAAKPEAAAAAPSSKTLVAMTEGEALGRVIANAGLTTALEGVGPYTVFAPPASALKSPDFADPAMKAEAAALLRAHIVPGAVTRADIAAAVEKAGAPGAQMRTMAETLITFSRDGDAIVATGADGTAVRLTGSEGMAKNGVVQPVDGLLVKAAG